jgi:hypothetical protein
MFALVAVLTVLWTPQEQASRPAADPVVTLVRALEQAAAAGDRETIRALGTDLESAHELAVALTTPVPARIVIKERDRTTLPTGLRLLLEVFWERSLEGRLGTWSVELESADDRWRIARATRLAHVAGL